MRYRRDQRSQRWGPLADLARFCVRHRAPHSAERRAVASIRSATFRDGNRAVDERPGDAGLLTVPPDPFRQQLVRGGRGGLLRQPVIAM